MILIQIGSGRGHGHLLDRAAWGNESSDGRLVMMHDRACVPTKRLVVDCWALTGYSVERAIGGRV